MHTKIVFAGMAVALLAIPLISSAASIHDLQSQLNSLLSQIRTLESGTTSSSGSASASVSASGSGTITGTVMSACPVFSRSLSLGSRGDEVSQLQEFLQEQGYLNASATGYFGALTKSALGRWQVKNSIIVSNGIGFGVFGPMSRSFYARFCGQGAATSQPFSADPRSGAAPLAVRFTTSDSVTSSSTYSVDFGDGTSASMTKGNCIAITAIVGGEGGIRCSYSADHSYNSNGTYTARLLKETPYSCPSGLVCAQIMMMPAPQTVASLTIAVGTSTGAALRATPTSGPAPLSVTFSVPKLASDAYWSVNFGDGKNATLVQGTVTHHYASNGTYTATALSDSPCLHATPACSIAQREYGSVVISVDSTTTSSTSSDQKINAPGSVTLGVNGIAEVRNENYYFTLNSLTSSSATIQLTQVGCWNSFPSDTPPQIRCMIAVVPIPPVTLSIGQSYAQGNYGIQLTSIANSEATFSITAPTSTTAY